MIPPPHPALLWVLGATFAALGGGSIARLVALRNAEESLRRRRLASLRTWWMITGIVGASLLAGRPGVCLLLAVASCVGWHEWTALLGELRVYYGGEPELASQLCAGVALPEGATEPEVAAWTMLVSALHNLDITKTRQ